MITAELLLQRYEKDVVWWAKKFKDTVRRSTIDDIKQNLRLHLWQFLSKHLEEKPDNIPDYVLIKTILGNKSRDLWKLNQVKKKTCILYGDVTGNSFAGKDSYDSDGKSNNTSIALPKENPTCDEDLDYKALIAEVVTILNPVESLVFYAMLYGFETVDIVSLYDTHSWLSGMMKDTQKRLVSKIIDNVKDKVLAVLEVRLLLNE